MLLVGVRGDGAMEVVLTYRFSGSWEDVRAGVCDHMEYEDYAFLCNPHPCTVCPWDTSDLHEAKRRADACTPEQRKALQIDAFDAAFKEFRDRCQKEVKP
jgi:hypothetical protein